MKQVQAVAISTKPMENGTQPPAAVSATQPRPQVSVWDRGAAMWLLLGVVLLAGLAAIHLL